jgi:hypothetical protein
MAKSKPKAKPKQPPAQTKRYVISDVDTLARVMRWDARQTDAAQRYRQAVDIIASSGSGSLDMDRVSGGSNHGAAPAQRYAEAAEFLAAVHSGRPVRSVKGATLGAVAPILTNYEGDILRRMVGHGQTSREIAATFFQSTSDKWREEITATVRQALTRIADWTLPPPRSRGIVGWTAPESEEA